MCLTPEQLDILESNLSNVELEGQALHEAVDHYLLKVRSWGKNLVDSQETNEEAFNEVITDLEKANLYLAQKTEEINNNQVEKAMNINTETQVIKKKDKLKCRAKIKTVDKMKMMEDRMVKAEDALENLLKEKKETFCRVETLEKKLQGVRRLLDLNRLEEEVNVSEAGRKLMAQTSEKIKSVLEEKVETGEEVNKKLQEIEERLEKTVEQRITSLKEEFKISNAQSHQKEITDSELPDVEVCAEVCDGQWESEEVKKRDCTKNPGHEGFINISDFGTEHLPAECYRKYQVIEFFKAVAKVVVRVMVKYVSCDRPDGYFLADKRGQHMHTFGSGWVKYVKRMSIKDDGPCRCSTCRKSNTPETEWAQILVNTSMNVVYDSVEAANSTCELLYDSEEVRGQGHKLEAIELECRTVEENWCTIMCATHDQELINLLVKMHESINNLKSKANMSYEFNSPDYVAVLVSHPHGCRKQISSGKVIHRDTFWSNKAFQSSAVSCPGSSGGLVVLLSQGYDSKLYFCNRVYGARGQQTNMDFCSSRRYFKR